MAKKIVGIIAGVSWAVFGISFLFTDPSGPLNNRGADLFWVSFTIGFMSLIAFAVLALIDYARRPR